MDVKEAISKRRAYRSLEETKITEELVRDLAECASLSASCFNNQPWRLIFVYDKEMLKKMREALSKGNEWAHYGSMIIAVFSREDLDCNIKDRHYYLFDTGMATAFVILRATELGLVAHPIAGYSQKKAKEILRIPEDMRLIALLIVGKRSDEIRDVLSEKQVEAEGKRPERLPFEKFAFINMYKEE
ncbi:nitroreductase [candidate division TA06 bacterium]|uniref:Nitroreductase n=1 Tax=candidate division TA06 bacterium TaxID=2250710 RepID=A0A523UVE3_UNCT6|nr:MAG: nitroreductase [candidate division TA06 bacterium]